MNILHQILQILIICLLCFVSSNAFIVTSQEEMESKPLLYNQNNARINGKTLYFNNLWQNPTLPKKLKPLVLTKSTNDFSQKEKAGVHTYHRFEGNLEVTGILQYAMYGHYSGFYQEWILFFDEPYYKQNLIPKNKPYPSNVDIFPDSAYMSIKNNQLPKELYDLSQTNPLSIIGLRVSARLKALDITTSDGDEWEFFGQIENIQTKSKTTIKYPNKLELYALGVSDSILFYASKDSYINLRQSPNGKILQTIQKDDMLNNCNTPGNELKNQGILLSLGQNSTNPKWLKVAYIPPEAKDTSKAIYGVIHESQVILGCYEN